MPIVARKLRVEYAGAIYHVMSRGDRREPIFQDEADRQRFVETLGEGCERSGWQVHAYCLMPNHFHLVVETPQPTLVAGMKWFLGTYTGRFNRRHKLFGHLFSSRYKSLIVDGSGSGYLRTVCEYVHLNPVRAKLLTREAPLHSYRWSSYPWYVAGPGKRPVWLRVDRLLGGDGNPERLQSRTEVFPTGDGGAAAPGRSSAIQGPPAELVFWGQSFSQGAAGADGRAGRGESLWGGAAGERGGESRADCG